MRPPRHQSRESSEARGLLPASASIVESRKPLARLNVPSASSGMTTPASRASCRSLRLLTRSTAPRIHPLKTLTPTAAPKTRLNDLTTDPATTTTYTHTSPPIHPRLKLFHATTNPLDFHAPSTCTQPPDTPAQSLLNLSAPCYFLAFLCSLKSSSVIINHPSLTLPLTHHLPSAPPLKPLSMHQPKHPRITTPAPLICQNTHETRHLTHTEGRSAC